MTINPEIANNLIRLRLSQMIINEKYKGGEFKIPIHLAFGHEAIAVAVDEVMDNADQLVLSHRNIHYNLMRSRKLKPVLDEFHLNKEGIAGARLGSMNLADREHGVVYTSSILGNNLCVAAGAALGMRVNKCNGIVFVVTGDGAMEEGAFYESLIFLKTYHLSALVIVENNQWSLATRIEERRCNIDLGKVGAALDVEYINLKGNDIPQYIQTLKKARSDSLQQERPVIIEVNLDTLGDWRLKTEEYPDGKYINYHAGPAPTVEIDEGPIIREDISDPVYQLQTYYPEDAIKAKAREILESLYEEIR